jgi:hypothetical protein
MMTEWLCVTISKFSSLSLNHKNPPTAHRCLWPTWLVHPQQQEVPRLYYEGLLQVMYTDTPSDRKTIFDTQHYAWQNFLCGPTFHVTLNQKR